MHPFTKTSIETSKICSKTFSNDRIRERIRKRWLFFQSCFGLERVRPQKREGERAQVCTRAGELDTLATHGARKGYSVVVVGVPPQPLEQIAPKYF